MEQYSATISGHYSLFTNRPINELVSDYSLIAAVPELVKLETPSELDRFVKRSQAVGFNKEQFDLLYRATFVTVQAVRTALSQDATKGLITMDTSGLNGFTIERTIDPGARARNKTFTYKIDQTISLPDCPSNPESCNINILVDITIAFPFRNPSFSPGPDYIASSLEDMHIHSKIFHISNSTSSLDLSLNPKDTFIVTVFDSWELNSDESLRSVEAWVDDQKTVSSIKGSFSNQIINKEGIVQTVKLTGSLIGSISGVSFVTNVNNTELDGYTPGTISGEIDSAEMTVNLITEVIE